MLVVRSARVPCLMLLATFALSGCPAGESEQADRSATDAAEIEAQQDDRLPYQTLDTPPAPVLNPREALEKFVIAPGFRIELAAAEPLIEDPVAVDWDEDGNLFVAEMRAYMPDAEGTGEEEPIGAIVRLTDTDADGVFDQRELILDGLVLPRALRIVNEGLLVGEMGKLWLCPSKTGWSRDIDCSDKRFLGEYGAHQGSVEHAENGLLMGIDNWIYSAKSSRRLKIVNGSLVEEPTVFRGQWGITQDDEGRLFYNTNSNLLLGDLYDAQAIIASGNRGAPGLNARISANDQVFSIRVNPGVNRAYLPGVLRADGRLRTATSASGMVVYRGGRFNDDDPNVFVTEPAANLVVAFRLGEDGLRITSEHRLYPDKQWGQRDFLASTDERFRPVDVLNGPDGHLYVIDFYRGIIQDHVFLTDQLKEQVKARNLDQPLGMGRIWRVRKTRTAADWPRPDWRSLSSEQLGVLLDAPDIWRRATAQRLLLRSQADDVRQTLYRLVRGPERAAVHALWTLQGRGELSQELIRTALQSGGVLGEAALLTGGHLLTLDDVLVALSTIEPGSRLHLYALAALRHSNADDRALAAIRNVLEEIDDVHTRAFAQASVRGEELVFIQQLVAGGGWTADREAQSHSIAQLTQQYFRSVGADAVHLLDYIGTLSAQESWIKRALLTGLFETTREQGFERAVLAGPHELFDPSLGGMDATLWPAIARARRGFTWVGDTLAADAKPLTPQQSALMASGAAFFTSSCANCHGADGAGIAALGPPLADSRWVTEAPERLARIVLHGLAGPVEVAGKVWDSAMPGHKDLPDFNDRVASGLLTYLRRAWGHTGRAIDPAFVAQVKEETVGRTTLWTVTELESIDINTHYAKYAGGYGRADAPMTFTYDGKALNIAGGILNGPLRELQEDHFLLQSRGLKFEFVVADDGSVPAVRFNTGGASVTMPRVMSGGESVTDDVQ